MHRVKQQERQREKIVPPWEAPLRTLEARRRGQPKAFKIYNITQMTKLYATLPHLHSWLREIRLVTICEGRDDEPIRCRIEKASLRDGPRYEALSYTWGCQEEQQQQQADTHVDINGTWVAILPNLYFALRRLRWRQVPRTTWTDYLCEDKFRSRVQLVLI
jgi:Heterokaryon incompatibility protein (HET)